MEATLEQPILEVEKLLIFENIEEINKIVESARILTRLLNDLLACGLSPKQIKDIAISEKAIENFIFQEQLKVNKALAVQYAAGKKNLIGEYALPDNLEHMQRQLLQWFNYPGSHRGSDKYQYLKFAEGRFELDNQSLEKEFVMRRLKFYIAGEQLHEFSDITELCKCFEKYKMPNNQIRESSFLWNRIEPIGMHQYKPRATWFMRERN